MVSLSCISYNHGGKIGHFPSDHGYADSTHTSSPYGDQSYTGKVYTMRAEAFSYEV